MYKRTAQNVTITDTVFGLWKNWSSYGCEDLKLLGRYFITMVDQIESFCVKKVDENQTPFFYTMGKKFKICWITKLDKIHMPALKEYILDNFQRI
ncbi:hypothetical protein CVS40_3715 [Lucilia cuprina]|nr:hypothetical protein CVS40_3715 [Lucilia cuprina]